MSSPSLREATCRLLSEKRSQLESQKAVVGLDGFVDTIIHVVEKRESPISYKRLETISGFAAKIAAAAGMSTNIEYVTQRVKLGGNGPIMANALLQCGPQMTYIGTLGKPSVHPIFSEFGKKARLISVADVAATDAVEFVDGKLMCNKNESLAAMTWENLLKEIPKGELLALFQEASLVALMNWTMLPGMSEIWEHLQAEIAPCLTGDRRWLFIDLADPAKRTLEDLRAALKQVSAFESHFNVLFGMNFKEGCQVGEVLGLTPPAMEGEAVAQHAAKIRELLGVHTVVIHPTRFAAAADATGATFVEGFYTPQPKITTGAGDHFNAGFCVGRAAGGDLAQSLQVGVAVSGYYVREAASPALDDLITFIRAQG